MRHLLLGSLLVVLVDLYPPTAQQPQTTVIRAGMMVDVENGLIREKVRMEVSGGKIRSISKDTEPFSLPPSPSHRVIDLRNATVLPGLIDTHVHLNLRGQADSNAIATLLAGFTTTIRTTFVAVECPLIPATEATHHAS